MTTDPTVPASRTGAADAASRPYTVVGGGAIGGTLAFHLARAGHPVLIVDRDPEHVAALNADGLTLVGPEGSRTVRIPAVRPEQASGPFSRVLLCVKAQATRQVAEWLAPRLAEDGFVVSLQNGLNEGPLAEVLGERRVVGAFVNLFADVQRPGVVQDGGSGALVVGEMSGRTSERVATLVADLRAWGPARATTNVPGYLWAKLAFGAMLTTTALADAPMAALIDAHRPLMHTVAGEVLTVATALGVALEPFDAFVPAAYLPGADEEARETATDRLVAWLSGQSKNRSGIWRDIVVRRRPTEVPHHYRPVFALADQHGVPVPVLRAVLERLSQVEAGTTAMGEKHLVELGDLAVAEHAGGGRR